LKYGYRLFNDLYLYGKLDLIMSKIIVIEDDTDLSTMICDRLTFEHHSVECIHDGLEGLERLKSFKYDAIVLDWQLPNLSGVEICKSFRQYGGNTPVIMLTGKDSIADKEFGLDSGADDYLTKPFHIKELSARIRALLRRANQMTDNVLKIDDLILDPSTYEVTKNNQKIQLLPKEFALLEFLMRHPNQVFSAEALLDRVWDSGTDTSEEAIRTCLKRLRKKIDDESKNSKIKTVHGVGYKLEA
jgi:DNA-binding response OmpR family regulator